MSLYDSLKRSWQRVEAMPLPQSLVWVERINFQSAMLIAAATMASIIFISDLLIVVPQATKRKQLLSDLDKASRQSAEGTLELKKLREERQSAMNARQNAELTRVETEVAGLTKRISEILEAEAGTQQLAESLLVLESRNAGVKLGRMSAGRTVIGGIGAAKVSGEAVPTTSIGGIPPMAVQASSPEGAALPSIPSVLRQDLKFSIAGNYLAVVAFMEKLQQQPLKLSWQSLKMQVTDYPSADFEMQVLAFSLIGEKKEGR